MSTVPLQHEHNSEQVNGIVLREGSELYPGGNGMGSENAPQKYPEGIIPEGIPVLAQLVSQYSSLATNKC